MGVALTSGFTKIEFTTAPGEVILIQTSCTSLPGKLRSVYVSVIPAMLPGLAVTTDSAGVQVPTRLDVWVTGVRFALASETKISFLNGTTTTDVVPFSVRPNTNKFGFDLISITLPASLAGSAPIDYKVIVTVTKTGGTFTSRPSATAPQVTIIP